MYESSHSKFLRTTTGIQSGLDTFVRYNLFNHFWSFRLSYILCSSRLVVEGETGKEIHNYLKVAEKQLSDRCTYLKSKVIEKDLVNLFEQSSKMFENLQRKSIIQEREKNYFKFNFKKATNLGKLNLLPKIHKGLSNVPG